MAIRVINKTNKTFLVHPSAIRSLLKKNDFSIGSWYANGRISGMSNFTGGMYEVKTFTISSNFNSVKIGDTLWKHTSTEVVGVEISGWSWMGKEPQLNKVAELLRNNGYKVKMHRDNLLITK